VASIDSVTFDKTVYNPGDVISLTAAYTPDSPSNTVQTFNATVTIADAAGNPLNSSAAPFAVNQPQPSGDVVSVADDGNHSWAQASDTGTVAVFTSTA
jgi:hypothetical protein